MFTSQAITGENFIHYLYQDVQEITMFKKQRYSKLGCRIEPQNFEFLTRTLSNL